MKEEQDRFGFQSATQSPPRFRSRVLSFLSTPAAAGSHLQPCEGQPSWRNRRKPAAPSKAEERGQRPTATSRRRTAITARSASSSASTTRSCAGTSCTRKRARSDAHSLRGNSKIEARNPKQYKRPDRARSGRILRPVGAHSPCGLVVICVHFDFEFVLFELLQRGRYVVGSRQAVVIGRDPPQDGGRTSRGGEARGGVH